MSPTLLLGTIERDRADAVGPPAPDTVWMRALRDICRRDVMWGILAIRHTFEQVRSRARSSNPLARGYLLTPDANFLPRQ